MAARKTLVLLALLVALMPAAPAGATSTDPSFGAVAWHVQDGTIAWYAYRATVDPTAAAPTSWNVHRIMLVDDGTATVPVDEVLASVPADSGNQYTFTDADYTADQVSLYYVQGVFPGGEKVTAISNAVSGYPRCSWGWVSPDPLIIGFNTTCLLPLPGTQYPCAFVRLSVVPLVYQVEPKCIIP